MIEKEREKFDTLISEMNEAIEGSKNQKQADKIASSFDKKIEKADKELEAAFEKEIKEIDEALAKEQKASEPVDYNDMIFSELRKIAKKFNISLKYINSKNKTRKKTKEMLIVELEKI